jgi:pSer/pThr/pTyr-binding forkhead associated (FHA) protein
MGASILFRSGPLEKREFALEPGKSYCIGRSHDAQIAVNDAQISRHHCKLEAGPDGQWVVTDLGSANGIRIKGQKVASHRLAAGDVVQLGRVGFEFRATQAAAPPPEREAAPEQPAPAKPAERPAPPRPEEEEIPVVLLPHAEPSPAPAPPPVAEAPFPPRPAAQAAGRIPSPRAPHPAAQSRGATRFITPAAFAAGILCFFLPFLDISRAGVKIASVSGFDLIVGKTIEPPKLFDEKDLFGEMGPARPAPTRPTPATEEGGGKVKPEAFAILALLAGAAGLGLSFLAGRRGPLSAGIAGAAGAVLLVILMAKLHAPEVTSPAIGFFLALLLYLAGSASGFILFFAAGRTGRSPLTR